MLINQIVHLNNPLFERLNVKSDAELIAESEEEFFPELVGDEEAGLYFYTEESIYEEEDPYFLKAYGEGPSPKEPNS